ncbi:MAG: hypothetical protein ACTSWY_02775 [Promethearchaeota archaeon]
MIITKRNLKDALKKAIDNSVWKKDGKKDKIRKFDESLDIAINFKNIDVKDPQQKINQEFLLPNPIRKKDDLNICFITDGDQLMEVKKKGYDFCDSDFLNDLNKKDKKTKKRFVKSYKSFIARTDMMRDIARILGRFLGQSGKMPRPQPKGYGIVNPSDEIDKILENFSRRILLNTKRDPLLQTTFGRKLIEFDENFENLVALINLIENKLPNGQGNIKSIYIKTTMGKPSKVEEPK